MFDERVNDIGSLENIEISLNKLSEILSITVQVRRCGDTSVVCGSPVLKAGDENITDQFPVSDTPSYA